MVVFHSIQEIGAVIEIDARQGAASGSTFRQYKGRALRLFEWAA
jgi:hypothetical protein